MFITKESITFHTQISKFNAKNFGVAHEFLLAAVDCEATLGSYLFITLVRQIKETKSGLSVITINWDNQTN